MPIAKRWRVVGVGALLLSGAVALLHVPSVQRLVSSGSCPWERVSSPEKLEERRQVHAASLRATARAQSRPAGGLVLDKTTKRDVVAWSEREGLACHDELGGAAMRCERSDPSGAAGVADAFLRFNVQGALVSVDLVHAGTSPAAAAAVARDRTGEVERSAGPPSAVRGTASEAHLGGGRFRQAAAEFRFSDYAADVVATNLGDDPSRPNVVVREQYRSLAFDTPTTHRVQ